MSELLINVTDFETRVALLEDRVLQEVHLSRTGGESLTGNVYVGKVQRVIPGMQAAFVEIGLAKPGFLHVRDMVGARVDDEEGELRDIRELTREGQTLLVQVTKDPISTKGARLSTELAIASRYVVIMPHSSHIGISQRIEDEGERERLRLLLEKDQQNLSAESQPFGYIARTAAEGANDTAIAQDLQFIRRLWQRVHAKRDGAKVPSCVYEELPLHIRTVRDLVSSTTAAIRIDDDATFRRVSEFVQEFVPEFADILELSDMQRPLFECFGVEDEIVRCLQPQVELKSGGSLVIEQTEAMVTIDVNTGGYLGRDRLEETVFRTNLEAAAVIPRQLRLRNLGGIIAIDFIDMDSQEHQREVLQALEKAAHGDSARIRIDGFTGFGLVLMSRKRTRESLLRQLCDPCHLCGGYGYEKSATTVAIEILRDIKGYLSRCSSQGNALPAACVVRAHECVIDEFLDGSVAPSLAALEEQLGVSLRLQVEDGCDRDFFDCVPLGAD